MKRKLTIAILTIAATISMCTSALASDGCRTCQNICINDLLQQLLRQSNSCGGFQLDWNDVLQLWLPQGSETGKPEAQQPAEQPAQQPVQRPAQQPTEQPAEQQNNQTEEAATDKTSRSYELEVVRLVNLERAKNGLSALTEDAELSRIARLKSRDMHDLGYFDHTSPTYGTPFQMMKAFGVRYQSAGENIAMGYASPEAVVSAWMNSPGHRANILNASYTKIGVGLYNRYWTQHFIG